MKSEAGRQTKVAVAFYHGWVAGRRSLYAFLHMCKKAGMDILPTHAVYCVDGYKT